MKQDKGLTKLIIGLLLVVITTYMVLSGVKTITNPHKLVLVYNDVVEDSISLNTWAFRGERPLDAATGLVSYRLDEGERAAAGQMTAVSYLSQAALAQQQKLRRVTTRFSQLQYALSNEAPSEKNLEVQMLHSMVKLQATAARGEYTQLEQQADQYKKLVLRREYLQSEAAAAELGLASLSLSQDISSLQENNRKGAQIIYAPDSGLFSSCVDGYEQLFRPELLSEISASDFRELVAQAPSSNDGAVGKLVTSTTWYLGMLVPEKYLSLFQKQTGVSVRINSLAEAIPMSVQEIGYVKDGEAVVRLSSRRNLKETLGLREQTASIIFRSEKGIRLPKQSLRVHEDGSVGVYTLTGYQAEFKPVTVVAEDKNDYVVKENPKDSKDKRILRSGDEVIITTTELYEGKVVR